MGINYNINVILLLLCVYWVITRSFIAHSDRRYIEHTEIHSEIKKVQEKNSMGMISRADSAHSILLWISAQWDVSLSKWLFVIGICF